MKKVTIFIVTLVANILKRDALLTYHLIKNGQAPVRFGRLKTLILYAIYFKKSNIYLIILKN